MNTNDCKKMPGLPQKNERYTSEFWSNDVDVFSYNQLHKFWRELSPKAKQELLRVDKQALFEQARKNMCCSRCNGLLLEGFLQIVSYGRSLQQKGSIGNLPCKSSGASKDQNERNLVVNNRCTGELQDPSVHQWGGLTTTRDGALTLLDCYLYSKSFKGIQTVFESARAREKERELLYPDACGGEGRLWISQGMTGYGKGHGTRETCALHTTQLSCDTLVDFWSALEEESRQSLLRMKEDDFMERLNDRFEGKKFCRDCRKNVIREFKELKELKRMKIEPLCTDSFCVADTDFQYEVNIDSVRADWSEYFTENAGSHQFQWAIGTEEGKSDILEFKSVGNDRSVQVNGLNLCGFHECYITLRAFEKNRKPSEISVKAHALIEGHQCVHSRLVVGDGFVSFKIGESIQNFFEHAEMAEEEEDEDILDKDGSDIDDECLRPQRHAKTPELARDFLLNAAMVFFKEQIEKAYREGTARQNAHSIFVCLSSKLLEQRVHVACKEIVTLEKQKKLLEEEEKEKREEEERKERKRTKEKEKKLRRKERLKDKEREKEQKTSKLSNEAILPNLSREVEGSLNLQKEPNNTISCEESRIETGDVDLSPPGYLDDQYVECLDGCSSPRAEPHKCDSTDRDIIDHEDENRCFINNYPRPRFRKDHQPDDTRKATGSPYSIRSHEGFQCSDNKIGERHDSHSCCCNPIYGYREKVESNSSAPRDMQEPKTICKTDYDLNVSKPVNGANRCSQSDYRRELRTRNKVAISPKPSMMDPVNARKFVESIEDVSSPVKSPHMLSQCKATEKLGNANHSDNSRGSRNFNHSTEEDKMEVHKTPKNDDQYSKDPMMSRISSSDNCSSCLSEGDSNTGSSNNGNTESCSICNSEEAKQQSERRQDLVDTWDDIPDCPEKMKEKGAEKCLDERGVSRIKNMLNIPAGNAESKLSVTPFIVPSQNMENMVPIVNTGSYLSQPQSMMLPQMLNPSIPLSVFPAPSTMDYYHQAPVYWSAAPVNGLMPFPNPNHYVYTGPFGYSPTGEPPLYMQYGTPLNHSATPFFSSVPVPVFHPFVETNTVSTLDQAQTLLERISLKEPEERKLKSTSLPMETSSIQDPQTNSDQNFSLFHFSGGPGALSTVIKYNPANSKNGILEDLDHVLSDPTGNNEEKEIIVGKEYNLF